eukprot:GEMP01010741.1.p1 GENE.GEMP01010741.1~~GEMP01010741.1.p1  ORF type:complete len:503 (+),score=46.94 GEMP01010741.1:30-1538(+)
MGCCAMSIRSLDLHACEQDAAAHVFDKQVHVSRVRSKKELASYHHRPFTASSDTISSDHDTSPRPGALQFPQAPNPKCPKLDCDAPAMVQFAEALENSPALTSLSIFLGSYRDLSRLICVSRECRSMLEEKGVGRITTGEYIYEQISMHVFKIPFKLDTRRSLRRWENYQVYWQPVEGSGTPYWLVRGADGNSVGENLRRNAFAFGGSSVSGDNYSKTLYQLCWRSPTCVIHKEVLSVVDNSFPCRAACGFVQTNDHICYVFGGRSGTHYLDDLWSFKVREPIIWVPFVTQNACPAPRWAHSMLAVKESGFLLYGGSAPGRLYGDLWYFNGKAWTELQQPEQKPHERAGHAVAIVPVSDINWLYVYGGNTAGPVVETYSDLWRLPLQCDNVTCRIVGPWQRVSVGGPALTPRIGHSLTLCGTRLVIFGGRNLSATSEQQFAASMDIIDLDSRNGAAQNTSVHVPPDVRRTGHFVLNHPQGLVFAAGLSANRKISSTVLCSMV